MNGGKRPACADTDPEQAGFFSTTTDRLAAVAALHAIDTYCARCPVRDACYQLGRDSKAIGVWGGVLFPEPWAWHPTERTRADLVRMAGNLAKAAG